jgi:ATP:corrinoid adenosyltransferase
MPPGLAYGMNVIVFTFLKCSCKTGNKYAKYPLPKTVEVLAIIIFFIYQK